MTNILRKTFVQQSRGLLWFKAFSSIWLGIELYLHLFNTIEMWWVIIALIPMLYLIIDKMLYKTENIREDCIQANKRTCLPAIVVGATLSIQVIYWLAFFPGGFNLDAYGQWDQAVGIQQLNNWHPVLTTLWYRCLICIKDELAFLIFVQIFLFSLMNAIVFGTLYRYGVNKKWVLLGAIIVALNPAVGMNNVCLVKDALFSICVMLLLVVMIHIYMTEGEWINKWRNFIVSIIAIELISLIRHNGILIWVPFTVLAAALYRKYARRFVILSVISIMLLIVIEGPIFKICGIEQHNNVVGEIVGVPMSIMANSYVNYYDDAPDNVKDFLEGIATRDEWEKNYVLGEWDSCKWEFGGTELLKDCSIKELLDLTCKVISCNPQAAYESIRENTRLCWQVAGYQEWETWIYIEENDYGFKASDWKWMAWFRQLLSAVNSTFIGSCLFWNLGTINLLYMIILGATFIKRMYGSIVMIIPVLFYNYGTMLLLSGPSFRYFYFNSVALVPIFLLLLNIHNTTEKNC